MQFSQENVCETLNEIENLYELVAIPTKKKLISITVQQSRIPVSDNILKLAVLKLQIRVPTRKMYVFPNSVSFLDIDSCYVIDRFEFFGEQIINSANERDLQALSER